MSLIRIARKKKPNSHRDFTDFEKSLNKLGTSQEFIDYFTPKIDPYALKDLLKEWQDLSLHSKVCSHLL